MIWVRFFFVSIYERGFCLVKLFLHWFFSEELFLQANRLQKRFCQLKSSVLIFQFAIFFCFWRIRICSHVSFVLDGIFFLRVLSCCTWEFISSWCLRGFSVRFFAIQLLLFFLVLFFSRLVVVWLIVDTISHHIVARHLELKQKKKEKRILGGNFWVVSPPLGLLALMTFSQNKTVAVSS